MFNQAKRRHRQAVRFVDLVIGDALHAPALAFSTPYRRQRLRTSPVRDASGASICERCHVADTPLRRMRGLLGRRDLPAGEGVLLRPAGSIHTFFMRFPVDVVFLDRDGRVLRVVESLPPWRAAAVRGARAALELRAGESTRRGVVAGTILVAGERP